MRAFASIVVAVATGPAFGQLGPLVPPAGPISDTGPDLSQLVTQVQTAADARIVVDGVNTPGNATNLFRITQPGSYYLTGNIEFQPGDAGKNAIEIMSDDVTLDLNGFTIDGNGISQSGVWTNGNGPDRLAVFNGNIIETGKWAVGLFGESNRIVDLHVEQTGSGFAGIAVGEESIVDRCTVRNSGASGISVGFRSAVSRSNVDTTVFSGIALSNSCRVVDSVVFNAGSNGIQLNTDCIAVRCAVRQSGFTGITVVTGSIADSCTSFLNANSGFVISGDGIVRGCSSRDNDAHGIECSTAGAMIENNRVSNNDGDGIRLAGLCVATGNSVSNSGGAGIYMNGVANRVDSNMVFSNPVGIEQAVPGSMGNVVTRNVAANNTTNYMVTSASNFFAVTTDPGTAGPMDNVAQ